MWPTNREPKITLTESQESFQTWINRSYIGDTLHARLANATVLLVPNEGYADRSDLLYFPVGTEELFQFLRENPRENLAVDICIEDENYKELALHADWLIIANFVVTYIAAPTVAVLIAEYIIRRLGSRVDNTKVKSKITVIDERVRRSVSLSYEGPASEFRDTVITAIENFKRTSDGPQTMPENYDESLPDSKGSNSGE